MGPTCDDTMCVYNVQLGIALRHAADGTTANVDKNWQRNWIALPFSGLHAQRAHRLRSQQLRSQRLCVVRCDWARLTRAEIANRSKQCSNSISC